MNRTGLLCVWMLLVAVAGCGSSEPDPVQGGDAGEDGRPAVTSGDGGAADATDPGADATAGGADAADAADGADGADGTPFVPPTPPPPEIVEVKLSAAHAATCLVKQGDALPDAELPDTEGNTRKLSELLGERYTVVVLWSAANRYSPNLLFDMADKVSGQHEGVAVVGVSVGDTTEDAQATAEDNDVNFPNLLDSDKAYYAKVATGLLPRIYLLDAAGKILWFGVDYQSGTREHFRNALAYVTTQ